MRLPHNDEAPAGLQRRGLRYFSTTAFERGSHMDNTNANSASPLD